MHILLVSIHHRLLDKESKIRGPIIVRYESITGILIIMIGNLSINYWKGWTREIMICISLWGLANYKSLNQILLLPFLRLMSIGFSWILHVYVNIILMIYEPSHKRASSNDNKWLPVMNRMVNNARNPWVETENKLLMPFFPAGFLICEQAHCHLALYTYY